MRTIQMPENLDLRHCSHPSHNFWFIFSGALNLWDKLIQTAQPQTNHTWAHKKTKTKSTAFQFQWVCKRCSQWYEFLSAGASWQGRMDSQCWMACPNVNVDYGIHTLYDSVPPKKLPGSVCEAISHSLKWSKRSLNVSVVFSDNAMRCKYRAN